MRKKIQNAKRYVAEHPGGFLIGGVVVYVYTSTMVTAGINLMTVREQIKYAEVAKEALANIPQELQTPV